MLYQQRVMQEVALKLPNALSLILKVMPWSVKRISIQKWMQHSFQTSIDQGELDFFEHHSLNLVVTDIKLRFNIAIANKQFCIGEYQHNADCEFTGDFYNLLLIAAQKRDPDTLFFQRKLMMSGDTQLGLAIKNWLAGLDLKTSLHPVAQGSFEKLASWIDETAMS